MNIERYYIYALINPIDDTLFYIGRTKYKDLNVRLNAHLWNPNNPNKKLVEVLQNIKLKGMKPEIKLIETIYSGQQMQREIELIREYGKTHQLVNVLKDGYSARYRKERDI